MEVQIGGTLVEVVKVHVLVSGVWEEAEAVHVRDGGTMTEVFTAPTGT
ncbi:MAG: hypothetical protein LC687_04180 [Actinobacteria bacterium]|nr:hypothetical protein [Actinomycetota bacterium]MCA1807033.1 hypothetical protein [Actinomycetota bacterium]